MHPVQPIQRKIPWFFGVVLALLLAVCGGGCRTTPGFTFSLSRTSLNVAQGFSDTTTLTVTPRNGFSGTVNLALVDGRGKPVEGVSLSPTSMTVNSGPVKKALTLTVHSSVATGTYALQVKGTSGSLTQQASLSLTVSAPPPGSTWTSRTSEGSPLYGITYGGGTFVAVGEYGTILTSPDGTAWTQRPSEGNSLHGVTYGNSLFVAVGRAGTILTSPDGVNWTPQNSGTSNSLWGVTFGNGLFVAVGDSGTLLTSP